MSLEDLKPWIQPAIVLAGSVLLGLAFQKYFLSRMAQVSKRTKTDLDDLLVEACRRHILFWFLLGGLALAMRRAPLPEYFAQRIGEIDVWLADALILSLTLVASNVVTGLIVRTTARAEGTFASSSLLRNVARGSIVAVGVLTVIHHHTDISLILGGLGVGSLAVALALQPTLSNLFAGLHITLSKTVRIGDFIELENGTQGFVVDIGWRATKLREGGNNLVIVPNARLVEMVSKNYSMPDPAQAVNVPVGVSYDADLARVEAVALEVAREVQAAVPEAVKDFEPQVRFQAFGASSVDFVVVLRVARLPDKAVLVHEFIRRLKARFERERIEIPYPQRVVHTARPASGTGSGT